MALDTDDTQISNAVKVVLEKGMDGIGTAVQSLINEAMRIERDRHLNASPYQRTEARTGYANGFKSKTLNTRLGALNLSVPQVRDGTFYPSFLEQGVRSERALKIALAEMYVHGVSTRKVTAVLEEMCGLQVTSMEVSRASKLLDEELEIWRNRPLGQFDHLILDARYEKVRQNKSVVDCAVLIAFGIDSNGKRHVLGVSVSLSEAEVHWRKFLESLVSRGLHGLKLIVSDAHTGLGAARKAVFPSVVWQRCQFHLQQNAQSYVTSKKMRKEVAEDIRNIFNAANQEEAERLLKIVFSKYEKTMPQLAKWMEKNIPEGLSIFQFKSAHRRRLRTSNLAERVNRELKRRTKIACIFPSPESCERLITAILVEVSEEWGGRIYLSAEDL